MSNQIDEAQNLTHNVPMKVSFFAGPDDIQMTEYNVSLIADGIVNFVFHGPGEEGIGTMPIQDWKGFCDKADAKNKQAKIDSKIYEMEQRIVGLIKSNNSIIDDKRRVQAELNRANLVIEVLIDTIVRMRAGDGVD